MPSYIMEAKENYDPANVALIDANTPYLNSCPDQQNIGMSLDAVRGKLMYSVAIAALDSTTNASGHTLWPGMWCGTASIANGGTVNTDEFWNFNVGEKDLTSGSVTFYQAYNVANTVPNDVGGYAHGWIYCAFFANGNTISLNGVTWTFVSGTAVGNQTKIQATAFATIQQLALDLNASANGTIGAAKYACEDIGILTIQHKTVGTIGNSYAISGGTPPVSSISGAHLTGGSVGSDGTWRRMTYDFSATGLNLPGMVNPRTNDFWVHGESCAMYMFRHSDNFSQVISPFSPIQNLNSPMYPVGITTDWAYIMQSSSPTTTGQYFLHLVPGTMTATEIAEDRLVSYADYPYPLVGGGGDFNTGYFRHALDHSGNFYAVVTQRTGTRDVRLWKFSPPSSASFRGSVTGGGFTDVTPWGPATGPNTHAAGYTLEDFFTTQAQMDRNSLMFLPVTSELVVINKFTQYETTNASFTASSGTLGVLNVTAVSSGTVTIGQVVFDGTLKLGTVTGFITGVGGTGTYVWGSPDLNFSSRAVTAIIQSDTFYDCTYVSGLSGTLTFDYHHAFVTGFMDSNWASTGTAGSTGAAYAVNACQEFNLYLGMSDYDYGVDYTKRWFLFSVQPVSGGVIDTVDLNTQCILVEYQFTSGSAPTVLQIYTDASWTADNQDYYNNIVTNFVVWASTPNARGSSPFDYYDFYIGDPGVFDYASGAWWLSGASYNMFQLDPAFTPRQAQFDVNQSTSLPPFLRLSVDNASTELSAKTILQLKGRLARPVPPPVPPNPPPPVPPNPFNCLVPVISQYANSPILLTILENFCEAVDPWPLINEFYNFLWNVDTAVGYGLDVWGRIVGVTRVLEIAQGRFFGFEEQLNSTDPFNVSPFFAGSLSGANYLLSDDAFRLLILVKALANITDGSVKSINTILRTLFNGSGNAYVVDGLDMTMTYTFDFQLDPVQAAIVNQSGVLPRSTGVSATVNVIT